MSQKMFKHITDNNFRNIFFSFQRIRFKITDWDKLNFEKRKHLKVLLKVQELNKESLEERFKQIYQQETL